MLIKGMIAKGMKVLVYGGSNGKIMVSIDGNVVECKTKELAQVTWESFRNILMGKGRV